MSDLDDLARVTQSQNPARASAIRHTPARQPSRTPARGLAITALCFGLCTCLLFGVDVATVGRTKFLTLIWLGLGVLGALLSIVGVIARPTRSWFCLPAFLLSAMPFALIGFVWHSQVVKEQEQTAAHDAAMAHPVFGKADDALKAIPPLPPRWSLDGTTIQQQSYNETMRKWRAATATWSKNAVGAKYSDLVTFDDADMRGTSIQVTFGAMFEVGGKRLLLDVSVDIPKTSTNVAYWAKCTRGDAFTVSGVVGSARCARLAQDKSAEEFKMSFGDEADVPQIDLSLESATINRN